MELEIVSKKIAVLLKELGFDWIPNEVYSSTREDNAIFPYGEELDGDNELYAPTQALVCKWFRDVHNIGINISSISKRTLKEDKNFNIWKNLHTVFVFEELVDETKYSKEYAYSIYEEAEEAGIIEAIKILKNRQNGSK